MKVVQLTTDSREHFKDYQNPKPYFGAAPEALLQGFAGRSDVEMHVVSCVRHPLPTPVQLAPNIWYHAVHVPRWGWLTTGYQGCIRAVRRKVQELRPDIVHGQGTERDCAVSAVWSGFPNVLTIHGNMAELARVFRAKVGSHAWLTARLEDYSLPRTAGVFCNSAYTESLVAKKAKKVWRVANPIRLPFFSPDATARRNTRPILINIGFVCPRKRQLEVLAVAENLQSQGLDFELRFIGHHVPGDPYAETFLAKVRQGEQAGYARYVGTLDVQPLIAELDGAAGMIHMPSEESFGLVVAEALARNVRFFGARLGGIQDICSGVPGTELFSPDDWSGLTNALSTWIKLGHPSPVGAAELIRSRYHPEVIASRHVEIYREVLSSFS
jgi:glycosyltransferase involved in cell wall biosynthesis